MVYALFVPGVPHTAGLDERLASLGQWEAIFGGFLQYHTDRARTDYPGIQQSWCEARHGLCLEWTVGTVPGACPGACRLEAASHDNCGHIVGFRANGILAFLAGAE